MVLVRRAGGWVELPREAERTGPQEADLRRREAAARQKGRPPELAAIVDQVGLYAPFPGVDFRSAREFREKFLETSH